MKMGKKAVMVSVIVLTFNHETYVAQALDSIMMQKVNFEYEILIGDDASTDKTPEILKEYQKRYPDFIRLWIRNRNLGAARNAYELLMLAQGYYLAFCEGDDFWLSDDKLQTQVDFLESHPEYIGCSHRCRIVDEHGVEKKNQRLAWVKEKKKFTLNDFRGIYLPGQTATIVKRNIFKDSEQDFSFLYRINRNISDRTSSLLYLSKGQFGFIPRVMSAYRQAETAGLTNRIYANNLNHLQHELEFTEQLEHLAAVLMPKKKVFDPYYRRLYAESIYKFIRKPSAWNKELIVRAAAHIGCGIIHPLAFVMGVVQRLLFR